MSSFQVFNPDQTALPYEPDQDEAAAAQEAFDRNTRLFKLAMIGAGLLAVGIAGLLAVM